MAIDSVSKRASSASILAPFMHTPPFPSGATSSEIRKWIASSYVADFSTVTAFPSGLLMHMYLGQVVASAWNPGDITAYPLGVDVNIEVGEPFVSGDATVVPDGMEYIISVGAGSAWGTATAYPQGIEMVAGIGQVAAYQAGTQDVLDQYGADGQPEPNAIGMAYHVNRGDTKHIPNVPLNTPSRGVYDGMDRPGVNKPGPRPDIGIRR
jgi:hypothetical protein